MSSRVPRGVVLVARAAYGLLLTAALLASLARLGLGALAVAAMQSPSVHARVIEAAEAAGNASGRGWTQAAARGVLVAADRGQPFAQSVLDLAVGLVDLGLAAAALAVRRRTWSLRWFALGAVAVAGACSLSAQVASAAVLETGVSGGPDAVLLNGAAVAALVLALLSFPSLPQHPVGLTPRRALLLVGAAAAAFVLGAGVTAVLPAVVSQVALFGVVVPVAGLAALGSSRHRGADEVTGVRRTQLRLLFSVLVGVGAIIVMVAVITVLLWSVGWKGLTLADPTASSAEPVILRESALLFWASRAGIVAVVGSAVAASRLRGSLTIERRFSRGLVVALVATLLGGAFVVLRTFAFELTGPRQPAPGIVLSTVAAVPTALALFPVYLRVERWVDRLLYGRRPTPYSVLAGLGAFSRSGTVNAEDLARVAEAVGRGIGAQVCRLTVRRPGLGERTYAWSQSPDQEQATDEMVVVPIRLAEEEIGVLTVDQAAVAGLQAHRQHLLDDIADSLGAVLQANRLGIELERQLRAVRAHAAEIATSRRRLVAEMDAERRRIERDLHDGAQHHLVSLRLSLGLVEHQVATGRFDRAAAGLDEIADRIEVAESILAQTATGVSSSLLVERGLLGALEQELADGRPAVLLDADGVDPARRFPAGVESTVWFCCLEAVNNARKHAPGAAVVVRLSVVDDALAFSVRDDGPGWDSAAEQAVDNAGANGRGLRNVASRVSAAGGRITVRSAPGKGTTVEGSIPLPAEPLDPPEADHRLVEEVRQILRAGVTAYGDAPAARRVRHLLLAMGQPLEVAVISGEPSDAMLVKALADGVVPALDRPARLRVTADAAVADVYLLLLRRTRHGVALPPVVPGGGDPFRRLRTIGVLVHDDLAHEDLVSDEDGAVAQAPALPDATVLPDGPQAPQVTARCAPEAAEICRVLVPVSARLAVETVRERRAASAKGLAAELFRVSGLSQLRDVLDVRFTARTPLLKAWSVLRAFEVILRTEPPSSGATALFRSAERIRSSASELVELDAVDALRSGEYDLDDEEVASAALLLGEAGRDARTRLGLPPDAGADEVAAATTAALNAWRRRASHPAEARPVRALAGIVVQSCEQILQAERE